MKVGGKVIKDVKFADDQGIVADCNKGLQAIMNDLNETAKKYTHIQGASKKRPPSETLIF